VDKGSLSENKGLRGRSWRRFLRAPDPELLEELYVPAIAEAVRYDRCCAYFSSSVLSAAARGFGKLIERLVTLGEDAPHPAVRLVVNEELPEEDARTLLETGDTIRLEALLNKRLRRPKELLQRQRLAMLAWLLKAGLLDLRVGVMRSGEGIVHAKFGVMTDPIGNALVFSGSGNESAPGLLANYERLEVSASWDDPERYSEYADEFEALWKDRHETVHTVTLPEAIRLKLIRLAPKEPPVTEPSNAVARQRAAMIWRYIVEAPFLPDGDLACDATAFVEPWPHQRRVIQDVAAAWPEGRLLCDEVGMGKTVEAILVLRRLLAGRGVRRVLVLLPKGLLKQWQAELREKGGLIFPRLEGLTNLVWPDGRSDQVGGLAEALMQDVLLMSRETARTESNRTILMEAPPWDLIVLDEAHAARRRKQEEGEFNGATLLLALLRELQLERRSRGIMLLSATPMQTHPWEPWDLLQVLGEGGAWMADFGSVRRYYGAVAALEQGACNLDRARSAAVPMALDPDFPAPPGSDELPQGLDAVARVLTFASPSQRPQVAGWLRAGSPLSRRMHRNTRATLRRYHALGLLGSEPTRREVDDRVFDFASSQERQIYNDITGYIDRRFQELEQERPGKGFVMTIYRRRAASSPYALEQSLRRRQDALAKLAERRAYDPQLETDWDARDLDDLGDLEGQGTVSSALPSEAGAARRELREIATLLEGLQALHGRDTKRDQFFDVLRQVTDDGRSVLIFTEYTDTLDYLRDQLQPHYGEALGCYSGRGGEIRNGSEWEEVPKDVITASLRGGAIRVLVCTDAASEGLNLQSAGALINYDLPWNPSKVEQRIGRIDRIGQQLPTVRIVNLFLHDSVDERVYRVLRRRCGLFEHFVGPMQPVLARARRMLLGQVGESANALEDAAQSVEAEPLANETYVESEAAITAGRRAPLTVEEIREALDYLTPEIGIQRKNPRDQLYTLSGIKGTFAAGLHALEHNAKALPLSPFEPALRDLSDRLGRPGERLPLVVGSHQHGAFRASLVYWVKPSGVQRVDGLADLKQRVDSWNGSLPTPDRWLSAKRRAEREARSEAHQMREEAQRREEAMRKRQFDAAQLRLLKELGRYFASLGATMPQYNQLWYQQMTRDIATAQRLRTALNRVGGDYPVWPKELEPELEQFRRDMTENQRKARIAGKEIDAALQDPRWTIHSV
jgi:superfamily II DNA or RNA helicase